MDKFEIRGGVSLDGELEISSAKNSVLALLAAAILTDEPVVIHNCPEIGDVYNMLKILEALGCKILRQGRAVVIDSSAADSYEIPRNYGREIRSSIFMLGSILGRFRKAKAVFPGGCDIGLRPIDLHLKGLRELNVGKGAGRRHSVRRFRRARQKNPSGFSVGGRDGKHNARRRDDKGQNGHLQRRQRTGNSVSAGYAQQNGRQGGGRRRRHH